MDSSASPPATLRAGDSAEWVVSLPDYPAGAGWELYYRLLWRTGPAVTIAAAADGDDHAVALTGAQTASWQAGPATLVWWVVRGEGEAEVKVTLDGRLVEILPDLTTAATHDPRTLNQRALADAQAALAAHMASGRAHVEEYEIAGRRQRFRSVDELRALVEYYQREVATERAHALAAAGVAPGRILTRF